MIFAVALRRGDPWDCSRGLREQEGFAEHADFMDGLVDAGVLLVGGPVGDTGETLHMMRAVGEGEIRERWAADPWIENGMLAITSIEPWTILLDGLAINDSQD